ncbi:AAA family ATPase [Baia soyae]|uniref:Uridine kinase n=1 Tax=Baia soyae TaxID=1544746 RepID=A0A4R2RP76_9BACL|nr:AAA family ATPase [Baia soyae]TCP64848.1 uridine kinase [Baia soyae]
MTLTQRASQILDRCLEKYHSSQPFLLGIDGLSGSGKTTLTAQLQDLCRLRNILVTIIHMDDHIVPREQRYDTGEAEWREYYYLQWDRLRWMHLLQELRKPIEQTIQLEYYQKELDEYVIRNVRLSPQNFVIVEGIFLQREEWRSFFDYVIYLDMDRDIRNDRVLERDTYIGDLDDRRAKYIRRYWPAEDYYLEHVRPKEPADIVIS